MSKLTVKQENFVQGLVAGLSQRQAYIEAGYKTDNMTNASIDSVASRMLKNVKVLSRYRELLKESSNMILWSRESAFSEFEWLKNQAKAAIEDEGVRHANSTAFISAMEGMNQMAFRDLELADKKLLAEIELLQSKVGEDDKQDERILEYTKALRDVIEAK
ncbi:terminase [Dolosigranulum pigrum]|uniref:terminase small subunit n=1 Tax=Dolosigranulum pigrum TaxID=29394 RepID=UPI000DBFD1B7|nr:terminase small subunit [Dolosigranulum pigrum]RAN53776.1 terminase [Dolosigranulum pigrum]